MSTKRKFKRSVWKESSSPLGYRLWKWFKFDVPAKKPMPGIVKKLLDI